MFHSLGKNVVAAIRQGDIAKAEKEYQRATEISEDLISEFNRIIEQAKKLDQNKLAVFEP